MMQRILVILLLVLPAAGIGQIKCNPAAIEYGTIERNSNRIVDITITNTGPDAMLLRSTFSREYSFLFSSKKIAQDSSITLRVQFNPLDKGAWTDKIELFFTTMSKPVVIKVTADVQYIDRSANPSCPSFNDQPANCCPNDPLTIVVKNAQTLEAIKDARVRLIEQGAVQRTWKTDKKGTVTDEVPISYYYLLADAEGYFPDDTATYINRRSNYFEFFLEPRIIEEPLVVEIPQPTIEPIEPSQPIITTPAEKPVNPISADGKLDNTLRPNNVVFLVDISESMAKQGKLDVLKNAMYNLFEVLRPNDKISIMTYATKTEVVAEGVQGNEHERLVNSISTLTAGGMTAGVKGFRNAYEIGTRNFQENGNNQVIVATDGSFRASDNDKIKELVKEYRDKGLITTIIGVRCTDKAAEVLKELAELGGGTYLHATDFDSGERLLQEEIIRRSTKE
ncbi:MAG: VWA domain-containing protein [Flavobacteriales bacterium]|nr:VWA domain-containing protein [Flavobacteriales bacterium]